MPNKYSNQIHNPLLHFYCNLYRCYPWNAKALFSNKGKLHTKHLLKC